MDKFIAERSKEDISSFDILQIALDAKKDQKAGNKVIDASIGVFLNENKTLNGVDIIKKNLNMHISDNLSYPPIIGSQEFKKGVLKWLFKEKYNQAVSSFSIPFSATLGGTGACYIAFSSFLEEKEAVLLPDIMWNNYQLIAQKAQCTYLTYPLFSNHHKFNIKGLIQSIQELAKKQKHVLAVINDPCQNPTGYCMSKEEYHELFIELEKAGQKTNLSVLFDIAYLDYNSTGKEAYFLFDEAVASQHSFLPLFAFSASKSFGMYGLRVGALFGMTDSQEESKKMISVFSSYARGTYSCPDGPAINSLALVLNDADSQDALIKNIIENQKELSVRGAYIKKALDKSKIAYLPYQNGFFITITVKDSQAVYNALKKKHCYVVPLDRVHIRIALSGLSNSEIDELIIQLAQSEESL